ncbi:MAG: M20 family metallopeptidase [Bacteroidota bacterium]
MENLIEKVKLLSKEYLDDVIAWRRHFHAHPELAFEEYETASYLAWHLEKMGIEVTKGVAKTGIVALIEGKDPDSRVIALRSDMDALNVIELTNAEYRSQNEGVMHACGHDAHMASLLGTARILNELKNEFSGTVKLIFQPSEEKYPGGASVMIQEGVLENPAPVHMFGQHVLPTLDAGKIGLKAGMYMASTDEVFITVKGKGGHAATPELNIDPVVIASYIVVALQQIVSRNATPAIPSVLSFGRIIGNGRTNIIPDQVILEGTFRTYSEKWRDEAHEKIKFMSEAIAESMGGSCEVFIDKGYPFLVNDEDTTRKVKEYAIEFVGKENVIDVEMRMTAEDFAYYSQKVPSCFYRLGVRNEEKNIHSNLHTATFNIDETALETGMGFMAWIALRELGIEK